MGDSQSSLQSISHLVLLFCHMLSEILDIDGIQCMQRTMMRCSKVVGILFHSLCTAVCRCSFLLVSALIDMVFSCHLGRKLASSLSRELL